jgi:hypothetical protein
MIVPFPLQSSTSKRQVIGFISEHLVLSGIPNSVPIRYGFWLPHWYIKSYVSVLPMSKMLCNVVSEILTSHYWNRNYESVTTSLVEQELLTHPEHLSSAPVFSWIRSFNFNKARFLWYENLTKYSISVRVPYNELQSTILTGHDSAIPRTVIYVKAIYRFVVYLPRRVFGYTELELSLRARAAIKNQQTG